MPADALPIPPTVPVPGAVSYRHEYRDALGRPLVGSVTLTPETRTAARGVTIPAAPLVVPVVAGVLAADLPPGIYQVRADLRTVDGTPVVDTDRIAVRPSS
jgi:hypothetical protein